MRRGCGRRTGAGGGGGAGEKGGTGGCLRSGPRRLSLHPKEVPRASLAAPQNVGRAALRQAARTQSRGRTPAQNPPCFQVFTCAGPGPGVKVIGVRGALETRRNPLETAYERHKSPLQRALRIAELPPASSSYARQFGGSNREEKVCREIFGRKSNLVLPRPPRRGSQPDTRPAESKGNLRELFYHKKHTD